MPAALPYSKQTPGRTFIVAASVLGIVALTQIAALGWAFAKRVQRGPVLDGPLAKQAAPAKARSSARAEGETLDLSDPFPETPSKEPGPTLASAKTGPIMPPARPQPVPLARLQPAPDTRFGELVQQGKTLRERGDTSNALIKFREAYALEPRNPAGIAEIAVTYEKMGLPDKASEQWKRVFDMGESAGVYYSAAGAKLKEAVLATQAALQTTENRGPGGSTVPTGTTFAVGSITSQDVEDPKSAKRLVLRVPITLRSRLKVSAKDVAIQVLFYDLVGDKPQRTNANVSNHFSTAPVDWRDDDTEILEVEYNQPPLLTADAKAEGRRFYGYIVRVYYRDELQATRSEPPVLGQRFPASQTLEKENAP